MTRTTVVGLLAGLAVALAVGVMISNRPSAPPAPSKKAPAEGRVDLRAARSQERRMAAPALQPPPEERPARGGYFADPPQAPPPKSRGRTGPDKRPPASQPAKPAAVAAAKPQARNPAAREALGRVGFDPAAEAVWYGAINDPDLPAEERKNLIEDLNEAGFADPRNPTEADLPLILSRLALIEDLGPASMDEVNNAAFREAYKDLMAMYLRLTGQ